MPQATRDITAMLLRSRTDEQARDALYQLVYYDLRQLARYRISSARPGETLSVTSLVNEAYLKLTERTAQQWNDRNHFMCVAAKAMRQITIDYVRSKLTDKRGSGQSAVSMEDLKLPAKETPEMVLALEEGLQQLAQENTRLVDVVECRFFAGMTIPETAAALDVSNRTVERDWVQAREWLKDYLT